MVLHSAQVSVRTQVNFVSRVLQPLKLDVVLDVVTKPTVFTLTVIRWLLSKLSAAAVSTRLNSSCGRGTGANADR